MLRLARQVSVLPLFVAVLLMATAGQAVAAAGNLDPSFGTGGIVQVGTTRLDEFASDVVVAADGTIITAGTPNTDAGRPLGMLVLSFLPDGSLNPSFGSAGKVLIRFPRPAEGDLLAKQPDGKLIVAGSTPTTSPGGWAFALARLLPDGHLDPSYGNQGRVVTPFQGFDAFATDIALDPSGGVVVGGSASYQTGEGELMAVARYNPDGSLDTSFGGTPAAPGPGKGLYQVGNNGGGASGVAVQPDGSILLAGTVAHYDYADFGVLHLFRDGTPDVAFGYEGVAYASVAEDHATGVLVDPASGKILAFGYTAPSGGGGPSDFALARFTADGYSDSTFGTNGVATTNIQTTDEILDATLQPDGRIVAVGFARTSGISDFAVARYLSNGAADATFGTGGFVTTSREATTIAEGVALQADGKVVVSGCTGGYTGTVYDEDVMLVRYLGA